MREKVMATPLGPNGRKMLEARRAEGKTPEVDPWDIPSSYRVDKARRAEWIRAVKEGREEQLRIENWMKLQPHLREGN
jgi:NADH-quinone oxidoreductase subunit B